MLRLAPAICMILVTSCGDDGPTMPMTPVADVNFTDTELQGCYEEAVRIAGDITYAEELEVLGCNDTDIRDLSGIEVLSGLLQIELRFNTNIDDLSPLLMLPNLDTVDLGEAGIDNSDLATVARLEIVEYLRLSGNNLGDISLLSTMTNIRTLILDSAGVTAGVRSLVNLERMTRLSLMGNPGMQCSDIEFLHEEIRIIDIDPDLDNIAPGVDCSVS